MVLVDASGTREASSATPCQVSVVAKCTQSKGGRMKPCPFCGAISDLDVVSKPEHYITWYYVSCWNCKAQGPRYADSKLPILGWDTRYTEHQRREHDRHTEDHVSPIRRRTQDACRRGGQAGSRKGTAMNIHKLLRSPVVFCEDCKWCTSKFSVRYCSHDRFRVQFTSRDDMPYAVTINTDGHCKEFEK